VTERGAARGVDRQRRLKVLNAAGGTLFDWIIVDSPPAVPVSDASQLANFCDGVLMVVRSNATPYDSAQKARQEFAGKTLVGVVAERDHSRRFVQPVLLRSLREDSAAKGLGPL